MKLSAFLNQFGSMSEAFWQQYPHPFLIEQNSIKDQEVWEVLAVRGPEKGAPAVLGRNSAAHIRIRDKRVSNRHAEFIPPPDPTRTWRVRDLGSTNGTRIDGVLIDGDEELTLQEGSRMEFGPEVVFTFHLPSHLAHVVRDLGGQPTKEVGGSTVRLDPNEVDSPSERPRVQKAGDPIAGGALYLYGDPFDPVVLLEGKAIILGRKAPADLILPHSHVSRKHLQVELKGIQVWVTDLGSANGTVLDEYPLGTRPVPLDPGQVLTIGPYKLWVDGPPSEGVNGSTMKID